MPKQIEGEAWLPFRSPARDRDRTKQPRAEKQNKMGFPGWSRLGSNGVTVVVHGWRWK